jgi:hypothetical protein
LELIFGNPVGGKTLPIHFVFTPKNPIAQHSKHINSKMSITKLVEGASSTTTRRTPFDDAPTPISCCTTFAKGLSTKHIQIIHVLMFVSDCVI